MKTNAIFLLLCLFLSQKSFAGSLTEQKLQSYAKLSLECVDKEFPNKTGHVVESTEDRRAPHELHPIFFGCFDWHSAVHGHWALVKTFKLSQDTQLKNQIIEKLDGHFKKDLAIKEAEYFQKGIASKNYERPYGYAWFLRLITELKSWQDPHAEKWLEALRPLEDQIVNAYLVTLKKYNKPVRVGLHENTAFAMNHIFDYAKKTQNSELKTAIIAKAKEFYLTDKNCPADYEPSGEDFVSPCLAEADIMARVLSKAEFTKWFDDFLPPSKLKKALEPQVPGDLKDLRIVHLLGLNFQKAWALQRIAENLPIAKKSQMVKAAEKLNNVGDDLMFKSDYAGTHWLASFAIFSQSGANKP